MLINCALVSRLKVMAATSKRKRLVVLSQQQLAESLDV
jgi:hypothetical protein